MGKINEKNSIFEADPFYRIKNLDCINKLLISAHYSEQFFQRFWNGNVVLILLVHNDY